ncbi:MAG: hypothetical protein HY719_02235 [Planctomycetes bacterium]|nr:hypothetical protein [Planctomycetota bacterium]
MIVWGGYDGTFGYFNTGGVYDPATDTWTATATSGAPAARRKHTAVWTGAKMIVWGGHDGSSSINTGGVYDPSTDTWAATTTTGAPAGTHWEYSTTAGQGAFLWTGDGSEPWRGRCLFWGNGDTAAGDGIVSGGGGAYYIPP